MPSAQPGRSVTLDHEPRWGDMIQENTIVNADDRVPIPLLIVGLGNEILMDDGVGVHAARRLATNPPGDAVVLLVGTALLDSLTTIERAERVIAIDAMEAGGIPGTVYACRADDLDGGNVERSMHELGLRAALSMLAPEACPEIRMIGVEPERIDYGLELTATVQASLDIVVREAEHMAETWNTDRRFVPE